MPRSSGAVKVSAITWRKKNVPEGAISSVNPIGPEAGGPGGISETKQHTDDTINYEISKTVRVVQNPQGEVRRLSVAAVIDGTYVVEKNDEGRRVRKYVPRTQDEINRFTTIVRQAMGYSSDREDQVSVETMPFSAGGMWTPEDGGVGIGGLDWGDIKDEYGKPIANILLILLIFIFVVRPLVKTFKDVSEFEEGDDELDKEVDRLEFDADGRPMLPKPKVTTIQEKAIILAREDINRSANIIKGWLSEGEE